VNHGAARPLRVLVVAAHEPWPLDGGGRLRLYNYLRGLSSAADVTLALPEPVQHAGHMPAGLRTADMSAGSARRHLPQHTRPWVARRVERHFGANPAVRRWLQRHAVPPEFDVTLLHGAVTGQYVDAVRVPVVWDAVDELVLYTVRDAVRGGARCWWRAGRAAALYALFERYVARRAQATIFASSVDASYARRWAGATRIETISNGVDFRYFAAHTRPPTPGTVAFVGSLSFPPNVEGITRFARHIWPRLHATAGHRLLIVGRAPTPAVRALAELPGVELHADVPDVRPYVAEAGVVIVPTRLGGGVKNKVLEACALRRPVVASPRALAGLSARRGRDVLCATNDGAWVRHITHLLANPVAAERVARHGYEWVRREHNWSHITDRLLQVLSDAAGVTARWPVPPRDVVEDNAAWRARSDVRQSCAPVTV